jgi:peptidoglycan L-alanyl-D-glutamate endopeptidase CwlK
MPNFKLGTRSVNNLKGVHPDLIRVATLGISYSPYDFAITEGLRDLDRQKQLVAQGYSKTLNSKHLLQPDGFGHAFDVMAVGDLNKDGVNDAQDQSHTWDPDIYRAISGAMKQAASELNVQIKWGGDFKSFFDGPHFELVDTQ